MCTVIKIKVKRLDPVFLASLKTCLGMVMRKRTAVRSAAISQRFQKELSKRMALSHSVIQETGNRVDKLATGLTEGHLTDKLKPAIET